MVYGGKCIRALFAGRDDEDAETGGMMIAEGLAIFRAINGGNGEK